MTAKNYQTGIRTGFGCKVDEDPHGGPGDSILTAWYECPDIRSAAETAIGLLGKHYEVTVFSAGHYNPRSYRNPDDIRRDFAPWLSGEAPVPLFRFQTAFDGEDQGIGLLQGWSDAVPPAARTGLPADPFRDLPQRELEAPDGSSVVFWFTEAGLHMFRNELDAIVKAVRKQAPWDALLAKASVAPELLEYALYRDDFQIAWSYTDVRELPGLDPDYREFRSVRDLIHD